MLYKSIAISFVAAALILTLIILFLSSARATIIIIPNQESVKTEFTTQVVLNPEMEQIDVISGYLLETTIEKEKTFQSSQIETEETNAAGEVVVINNYSKDQPLIASTRLLSPEGILFHLTNTVRVPAGGSVRAKVYADQPGKQGEIGPTRFTIPGLWPGLQDKIYAESKESMAGGIEEIKYVTQEDIDQAKTSLREEIKNQGLEELETKLREIEGLSNQYTIDPESISQETIIEEIQANVGDKTDEFIVNAKIKFTAIIIDEDKLFDLAKIGLKEKIEDNKRLVSIDKESFISSLEKYDIETNTAEIKTSLTGRTTITLSNSIFNPELLVGLNRKEINKYFSQFTNEIKEVKVRFFPFWVQRAPILKNNITFEIVD